MVADVIRFILLCFLICLAVRVLMSYFPIVPGGLGAGLQRFVGAVTDPVLAPVRRLIPPASLGGGATALDLSPIIVFFVVFLVITII